MPAAAPGAALEPCAPGARLVRLAADGSRSVLTPGFAAACDPALDFDAGRLFFAARRGASDPLRVWKMRLEPEADYLAEAEPLSSPDRSCRHPAPLPAGGAVYECGGDLWRRLDSAEEPGAAPPPAEEQITFSSGRMRAPSILPDGRILAFLTTSPTVEGPPGSAGARLVVSLPDGTWLTPWRDGTVPGLLGARAARPDRLLLTVGPSSGAAGTDAPTVRVGSLSDPLKPLGTLHFTVGGDARPEDRWELRDPAPRPAGGLVVAGRPGPAHRFGLALLEAGGRPGLRPLASDGDGAHLIQPVPVAPVETPMAIPSIVKPERRSGFLLLFEAWRTDDPEVAIPSPGPGSVAGVRIFPFEEGVGSARAVDVPPAPDGSVYLQVEADRPLGVALVGPRGGVLARRSEPVWVRPNERRACLGCHVSVRYAPPNRRPLALLEPAVRVALPEDEPGQGGEEKAR